MNEQTFDRIRDFVIAANKSDRELTPEWRAALHDVALELDAIAYGKHADPDTVTRAELAMSALAGVWLDDDEKDRLYLGSLDVSDPAQARRHLQPVRGHDPAVDIPSTVSLTSLKPWEQHIWQTPDLTVEERRAAGLFIRLHRGDLTDTGSLRDLYHALGNILRRQP